MLKRLTTLGKILLITGFLLIMAGVFFNIENIQTSLTRPFIVGGAILILCSNLFRLRRRDQTEQNR
ncbi:hypothetical protein AJ85_10915 [Alkalihalobacillus alcalophilus ATCC 27647 = CGMCC 1.3604]|uniref:Uncharacterized protein n=1 Tax=Alkalihalobacillus alcalophilus ATCC 27647 = CGMCC 1.3604 TaxID=1218173 RepID=A0A094YVP8_ALKAL|nr:hypothetical protein [Alkalihalobacillus alcalophilus]KGA97592.1 hypothetical protein BALCAV_0209605 [Alkalihalobacillus alcalophilus ATCC 27647 = CGMCC 1.3604]MED1563361.1 hypothetical protein [Alkalihalobacillus alcalophilus]THG90428.1 hypothetical protein AJ85_10915 [Alkalihalobacillus alcalophilus ATCC 27647 = CGMCC 1.3604]